jgi:hypothetical protein
MPIQTVSDNLFADPLMLSVPIRGSATAAFRRE